MNNGDIALLCLGSFGLGVLVMGCWGLRIMLRLMHLIDVMHEEQRQAMKNRMKW